MKLNDYVNAGEFDKARELQDKVNEFIKGLLGTPSLYGACKYILSLRGIETGSPRLPLLPIVEDGHKKAMEELNNQILALIDELK